MREERNMSEEKDRREERDRWEERDRRRERDGRGEGGHRHHLTPPAPHHAISSSHIMLTSLCAIANIAGVGMLAGPSKGSSKASTNFRFTS